MYNIFRLLNTIKYLKFRQVYFRFFYYARRRLRSWMGFSYFSSTPSPITTPLSLKESIHPNYILIDNEFTFLNLSHRFEDKINWNFSVFGKLWTYNLNYFEYLNQKELSQEKGLILIYDFMSQVKLIKDGMEPYPISLRGINWIKFLTQHQIKDQKIDDLLYVQYTLLMDNLEYHLLGNHLLENAFSLLFAAYYFEDEKIYAKASELLTIQLNEQLLEDGAHFELSPMYHQVMLFRLLDCINLVQNNSWKNKELLEVMCTKVELMFNWLNTVTFENGNIPLFNDSANKITPTTKELLDYKKRLHLLADIKEIPLTESGYRKIKTESYEMIVDVGDIGPDYIPGHAHSDIFNFELYIDGKPFIVDTGLSTYEANERRAIERSTCSHNTVEVDGKNQSNVWGAFRVAERAQIIDLREKYGIIKATHNGYRKQGILHTRSFEYVEDNITIKDRIQGQNEHICVSYLHFYPGINITKEKNVIQCAYATIKFLGSTRIFLDEYEYAPEFNNRQKAVCLKIFFEYELDMQIFIK